MPLTLHAAWLRFDAPFPDGQLFFWAETTDNLSEDRPNGLPTDLPPSNGNGRQRATKIPSHPFQASAGRVRALLADLIPDLKTATFQPANTTVWLPTAAGAPVTRRGVLYQSTTLQNAGGDGPAPPPAVTLEPWQVTGVTLPALDVLATLGHLDSHINNGGSTRSWRRFRLGNDLLFWSNAAKLALEFLAGQHYLPTLRTSTDGRFYAVWQPALLDSALTWRLDHLTAIMPPVCRAYDLEALADAPPPAALMEHFLAAMIDHAVRDWFSAGAGAMTPAGHWLERLTVTQRQLALPPMLVHELYQAWRAWIEQLQATTDANFRICFALTEPYAGTNGHTASDDGMTNSLNGDVTGNQHQLSAVESSSHRWTLRYYLQARDNPSLLIPAALVWQTREHTLRLENRRLDQPQERLLAGLGVASRLFAPIERSLRAPNPEYALLSPQEAHEFLREIGPLLESTGFGVRLPDWWRPDRRQSLGFKLRLLAEEDWPDVDEEWAEDKEPDARFLESRSSSQRRQPGAPVRYEWELTLGGKPLREEEFDQLAAIDSPLVQLHDQWVELDPEQMDAARSFLADRRSQGKMSFLQALRLAQNFADLENGHDAERESVPGTTDDLNGMLPAILADELPLPSDLPVQIPLETVSVEGWLHHTMAQLRFQHPVGEIQEPSGFIGELRPYQRRGVGWLVYLRKLGLGSCLADDMGLGKTIQALAMLLHVREEAAAANGGIAPHQPALLICPTSVVANWKHEVDRFAPELRALIHHGTNRLTGEEFLQAVRAHDLIITSYGTARRDIETLIQIPWSDLIIDEAQNIKNPRAKQTQAVRRIDAPNRVALTGTPVENRLAELWSIMEFLNAGYLEDREQFRKSFIVPIERYNDDQRAADLRQLVQPFLLRRLKSDPNIISDLPEKNEMVVYCSLTDEQASLYEKTVRDSLAILDASSGIQRRGLVLGLLTKLKQITNHPAHFLKEGDPLATRSGKLDRLTEMLDEALSIGDQALVFTQFVEMGHLLQRHLRDTLGVDVLFLHGGTPAKQRDQMVQEFQSEDGPPVFVLSLRAGGAGLNLTRANHVFHFDRWWNPAVENQATDRAFRIGQTRNVQVHKFVVAGTLEERINEMIESKQALAEAIVGSGEEWLTELNNDELRQLLMLRREAIA